MHGRTSPNREPASSRSPSIIASTPTPPGRFPGGFIKREGRPSEKEILTSRLIDRPIRPLFPEGFLNETQIIAMVLSADPEQDPNSLAIVGAAARAGHLRYSLPSRPGAASASA